jgi:hypothetical protein
MATRKVKVVSGADGQKVAEDAYTNRKAVKAKSKKQNVKLPDQEELLLVYEETRFF